MRVGIFGIMAFALVTLTGCGFRVVDEGNRGIMTHWGKVQETALSPGIYFYNPISKSSFEMPVRENTFEFKSQCYTRDTQQVDVSCAVTFYPEPSQITKIYSLFGQDWQNKLVHPAVQGSIKDIVGQFNADELISKRDLARNEILKRLQETLAIRNITITQLSLTNLDFADEYEKAVEKKVIAAQQAVEAQNRTRQVEEQAKQTILSARAEAESMRIKSEALRQNKGLTAYVIAEKWNGVLPKIMLGNSTPLIDLRAATTED